MKNKTYNYIKYPEEIKEDAIKAQLKRFEKEKKNEKG